MIDHSNEPREGLYMRKTVFNVSSAVVLSSSDQQCHRATL